jgi:hypothetical protein
LEQQKQTEKLVEEMKAHNSKTIPSFGVPVTVSKGGKMLGDPHKHTSSSGRRKTASKQFIFLSLILNCLFVLSPFSGGIFVIL